MTRKMISDRWRVLPESLCKIMNFWKPSMSITCIYSFMQYVIVYEVLRMMPGTCKQAGKYIKGEVWKEQS